MFAVNQIAFVYALKATTAVTVSLVFGLFPITVGVLAAVIGHEAMTRQKARGGDRLVRRRFPRRDRDPRRHVEAVG